MHITQILQPSSAREELREKIDWDAQWKVSTERAYLSSDPTHPIYLGNNRRFDIDPTWYDLGAESPKKEEKETPPSCGCCCG